MFRIHSTGRFNRHSGCFAECPSSEDEAAPSRGSLHERKRCDMHGMSMPIPDFPYPVGNATKTLLKTGWPQETKGALLWLTSIPPEKYHFSLHMQAFRDTLVSRLPSHYFSQQLYLISHPLPCPSDHLWTSPDRRSTFDVATLVLATPLPHGTTE